MPLDVTMPDGTVIRGIPDGTTKQEILDKYRVYKTKQINAAPPLEGHPSDQPNTFMEQAQNLGGHFAHGAVSAVTSIPETISNVAGGVNDLVHGKPGNLVEQAKNALYGLGNTVVTPIQNAAALPEAYGVGPHITNPATDKQTEGAAEGAGNIVGGIALGGAVHAGAGKVMGATPEGLQALAERAKTYRADNPVSLSSVDVMKPGTYVKPLVNVGAAAVEKGANRLAQAKAARLGRTPYGEAAAEEARRIPAVQEPVHDPDFATPQEPMNIPRPGVSPANEQFLQQLRGDTEFNNVPRDMEMRQPASPSQPIEPSPELQRINPQAPPADMGMPPTPEAAPPTATIEMQQPPASSAHGEPATPREIDLAHRAVFERSGLPNNSLNHAKIVRNVPYLLDTVPELKGVPPGANFDAKLGNAFDRVAHELKAARASVPPETKVPTMDAVKSLKTLEEKYPDQSAAVRTIDKYRSMLEEKPSMDFKTFDNIRQSIFDELKLSSAVGQEVYGVFKKVVSDISPELGKLNQKYYTVKSAIENARIDLKTKQRVMPEKAPKVQPTKGFTLPL